MVLKEKGRRVEQERQAQSAIDEELGSLYGLREPKPPSEFAAFAAALEDEQRPFAKTYWHMQCPHEHEERLAVRPNADGVEPVFVRCVDCDLVRSWRGTQAATKLFEWDTYCPDGFDAFDWHELYVRDRSMWMFIHDEVLAEMVEGAMTEEAA